MVDLPYISISWVICLHVMRSVITTSPALLFHSLSNTYIESRARVQPLPRATPGTPLTALGFSLKPFVLCHQPCNFKGKFAFTKASFTLKDTVVIESFALDYMALNLSFTAAS